MNWTKRKQIFVPDGNLPWSITYAQVPTVLNIGNHKLRLFYGTRDISNRTLTSFIDVLANKPSEILYVHNKPILELGEIGSFDDSGVMPSWIVKYNGTIYLYYIGWNVSTTVRYRLSIGLALSEDNGNTFKRYSIGPIMDRSILDPFFVSYPCVMVENGIWRMWYISCTKWTTIKGLTEPFYHIKYACSKDGVNWVCSNKVAVELHEGEAGLARPCVIKQNDQYLMWYCYRKADNYRISTSASYRIGFATSFDGIEWVRKDAEAGITISETGWDSEMIAYPFIYNSERQLVMLYNGNGFGKTGFGYAELASGYES